MAKEKAMVLLNFYYPKAWRKKLFDYARKRDCSVASLMREAIAKLLDCKDQEGFDEE